MTEHTHNIPSSWEQGLLDQALWTPSPHPMRPQSIPVSSPHFVWLCWWKGYRQAPRGWGGHQKPEGRQLNATAWCTWRNSPGTPLPRPTLRLDMSCGCLPPLEVKANGAGLGQLSWAEHRGMAAGWAWEPWGWTVYPRFHSPVRSREKRVRSHWMTALAFCFWLPADTSLYLVNAQISPAGSREWWFFAKELWPSRASQAAQQ